MTPTTSRILKNGYLIGMPLTESTEETWGGLVEGKEQIAVGSAKEMFDAFEEKKQAANEKFDGRTGCRIEAVRAVVHSAGHHTELE